MILTVTKEEEKIFRGELFNPGDPELRALKLKCHNRCTTYNQTFEDETEVRDGLVSRIFGRVGENVFLQGPIFIHYGGHTEIGDRFFGNFNLTIQDDARVKIGNDANFGPNVTLVTPAHPLLPNERRLILDESGTPRHLCYAKPISIGDNVWLCANVVVCGGVTIGDNAVIGAGSVVIHDIPANTLAAGNPCRVIREISEADSMIHRPTILGNNAVIPQE